MLHTCCATCSGFLASALTEDFAVSLYYSNSNIFPAAEYQRRLNEAKKYFLANGFAFIEDKYNHDSWLDFVRGLENEPERGSRCLKCYDYRLRQTARHAQTFGFDYFGTTLSISPHKDAIAINNLGLALAKDKKVKFLAGDWKKQDGFMKAVAFSHSHNFYRQNYCGCEFA